MTAKTAATPKTLVLIDYVAPADPAIATWSPFCSKVRRALNAAGLPFTTRHIQGAHDLAELNAQCQVPVLIADGTPITDSTTILATIAAWQGEAASPEALLYEELADSAINGFENAARWADDDNWIRTRMAFFGPTPPPFVEPMRAQIIQSLVARDIWRAGPKACWARLEVLLDALDARAPQAGFWLGETLTAADFALFGQLNAFRTPLTPAQADSVARRARLTAWLDRVDQASRG